MRGSSAPLANPYVGPRPFTRDDPLFGRELEKSHLLNLLISERIVLMHSPSGAGKTSLIQSGLIPALEDEHFRVLPIIRVGLVLPGSGDDPALNPYLSSLFISLGEENYSDSRPSVSDKGDVSVYLDRLDSRADQHMDAGLNPVVLIFDQFEEILTLNPVDLDAKREFFAQVGEALRPRHRWALFSMREKYVAGLEPYLRPIPTRLASTFRLGLLEPAAAQEAILKPAAGVHVDYSDDAITFLTDELTKVELQRQEGTTEEGHLPFVEPVQLQVVCTRLWERLPWAEMPIVDNRWCITQPHVSQWAKVDDALIDYYNAKIAGIAKDQGGDSPLLLERQIREWIDTNLITERGTRAQLRVGAERHETLPHKVLEALQTAYLIRREGREGRPGDDWYELAHDRLISPVRQNNAEWFDANLSPLQRQARVWDSQHRKETFLFNPEGLAEAEAWLKTYSGHLTDVEQDFLDQCRERERRRLEELEERRRELEHIKERERLAQSNAELAGQRARAQEMAKRVLLGALVIVMAIAFFACREWYKNRQLALANIIQRLQTDEIPPLINASEDDVAALLALQASRFGSDTIFDPDGVISRIFNIGAETASSGVSFGIFNDTLAPYPFAHVLGEGPGTVHAVAFSPDGRLLAAVGDDNRVRLWTVDDRTVEGTPLNGPTGGVRSLAFSSDSQRLAVGGCKALQADGSCSTGDVLIIDLASRQLWRPSPEIASEVRAVAFQPFAANGGELLVWGTTDGQLGFWNPSATTSAPHEVSALKGGVFALAFSRDGRFLAVGGCEEREEETEETSESRCQNGLVSVVDPSELAARPSPWRLWRPWGERQPDVRAMTALPGSRGQDVLSVSWGEGGTSLAAGSGGPDGGYVQLWNLENGSARCHRASLPAKAERPDCTLRIESQLETPVTAVAFNPDDSAVVASDFDMVRFWKLDTPVLPVSYISLPAPSVIVALAFRPTDERSLVTGSTDGKVRLWKWARSYNVPVDHRIEFVRPGGEDNVWGLAFAPPDLEPSLLASASEDGQLLIWDPATAGAEPFSPEKRKSPEPCNRNFNGDRQAVWSTAISENGQLLAAGYGDGTIRVWDVVDRQTIQPRGMPLCAELEGGQGTEDPAVRSLSFHTDGHHLVSGSWNGSVLVWDVDRPGDQPKRLDSGSQSVRAVSFSPDGALVAVGGCRDRLSTQRVCPSGGLVLVWRWQESHLPEPPLCCAADNISDSVYSLAFNRAGTILAVGALDGTIRRWNIPSFEPVDPPLQRHSKSVRALLFPDDDTLISVSNDSTVLEWNLAQLDDEPVVLANPTNPNPNIPQSAALNPEGHSIAVGQAYSGQIQIRSVEPERLVDLVCPQVGRNLTQAEWNRHVGEDVPYEQTCQDFPPG